MDGSHKRERTVDSSSRRINRDVETDKQHLLSNKVQKCIGWFFYENGFESSTVDSPSFKEMVTLGGDLTRFKIPNAWIDEKGHKLVTFVADCPAGPVYLKSVDVSDITSDVTALLSLLHGLVEEVGECNVVQIIAGTTEGWVGELGKIYASHDKAVFWSVALSHFIELMLMRIVEMHSFRDVLENVPYVWEFINNNPLALKTFRDQNQGKDITVDSSEFVFCEPYLMLESILNAKKTLNAMFASSDWYAEDGISISSLINDSTFWESVERVTKYTSLLIQSLLSFSTLESQHVGYIYDSMDSIKENIAKGFNHKETCYQTVWEVIDDVWSYQLYNPLHAAGYFLNPTAFYLTDFHLDPEFSTGLLQSVVHVVK